MKTHLAKLLEGQCLTTAEAKSAFAQIMEGHGDPAQVGALLALLAIREPSVEELVGVAQVMREKVVPISAPEGVIDTCGTGGLGSRIFNVSTTAALVAAACGVPVAKHGNRSVTSRSGSSDVVRLLGVNVEASPEIEAKCLREANICFAFAPKHHPAMRHVAAIRQALGFATIFNLIGPLTNPAGARRQLVGVKSPRLADKVLAVLVKLGAQRAMVVNGRDIGQGGLCELSISGPTYVASFDGKQTRQAEIQPEEAGLHPHPMAELEIATPEESAELVRSVLKGERARDGGPREIVLLNAAGALWVAGKAETLAAGVMLAAQAIDSGGAMRALETLARLSHAASF